MLLEVHSVTQSCPALCNPIDCGPQAPVFRGCSRQVNWSGLPFPSPGDLPDPGRKLEWVAISFSRGSSRPGDHSVSSALAGGFL